MWQILFCKCLQLKRQRSADHNGRLLFIGHHDAYIADLIWFSDDHGKTYEMSTPPQWKMDEVRVVQSAMHSCHLSHRRVVMLMLMLLLLFLVVVA